MWVVSANSVILVLVLCIPGPLGPGSTAKTSFGHKMAEAGGDPGGRWLLCRLVSHAASIHPLSGLLAHITLMRGSACLTNLVSRWWLRRFVSCMQCIGH